MIGFDEAVAIVRAAATILGRERVPLSQAHGRTLAAPVVAGVASPPADVSAMDGYAVRDGDFRGEGLRVVGESFPGSGFDGAMGDGECVRIFTGATLPAGADRVVIQEVVRREGERAYTTAALSPARHIRPRASDFDAGDVLLQPGRILDARALVAAAAADVAELKVSRRPLLTIIGTGDELAEPGQARHQSSKIPESVTLGVAALAEQWGAKLVARWRLADDLDVIRETAARALDASDLVVIIGGASVGERDYAKAALAALGVELLFSKVAIKPGKPVWFGTAGGKLVLGLPGNPTSALVTARLLLAPLIAGLCGRDPLTALRWRRAPLAADLGACGDRETFVRAGWQDDAALPLPDQDSGAQRALAAAELLLWRRAGSPPASVGEMVETLDF